MDPRSGPERYHQNLVKGRRDFRGRQRDSRDSRARHPHSHPQHRHQQKQINDLPLNGRNVLQLMQLTPGTLVGSGTFNQSATRPEVGSQLISASGGRGNSTTFVLDGGLHEDPYTEVANVAPNPDAIQEFSFQTNNYSAKFGGRGGGVVNMVTRSGSNGFHRSLYAYIPNHKINARNFFASTDDGLKRNQYGASLGGPVIKNRTFFATQIQDFTIPVRVCIDFASQISRQLYYGDVGIHHHSSGGVRSGASQSGNR